MGIHQVKILPFSVWGDGTANTWSVDLADYLPGVENFNLINAYTTHQETITQNGSTTSYNVADNLPATLTGNILTVTFSTSPLNWLEPYAGNPNPATSFFVAVSY